MLSSVAERVYWLGRYLERVENAARLINVYSTMLLDLPSGSHIGWSLLIDITGANEDYQRAHQSVDEKQVVKFLLAEGRNPASVINCVSMMRENARTTREIIPSEAWELINNLYLTLREDFSRTISRRLRQQALETAIGDCQRIFGVLTGCMNHDTAFAFIQLGRKIERADMTSRIVDVGSISMLPAYSRTTKQKRFLEPHENIVWMNVLRCVSGYQAYRQRTQSQVKGEDVVKFLLQDQAFPRAGLLSRRHRAASRQAAEECRRAEGSRQSQEGDARCQCRRPARKRLARVHRRAANLHRGYPRGDQQHLVPPGRAAQEGLSPRAQ